jgi:DNA-binding MltR family transcriptional regulator
MSNKSALRRLSKRFPPPPELKALIENLKEEPDGVAATIGAAIIESAVERVLIRHLKSQGTETISLLFENRGPLSDFHSKIVVGAAFGLLPESVVDDLQRIRVIRNTFAHARMKLTFNTKEIVRELQGSNLLNLIRKSLQPVSGGANVFKNDNKAIFGLLITLVFSILESRQQELGGDPMQWDLTGR